MNTIGPPPTGLGWDESYPDIDDVYGQSFLEIRDLRKGMRIRLEKEHNTIGISGAGGEHKQGSAISYAGNYSAAWPEHRPDGTTDLTAADTGRIALDTTSIPNRFAIYTHGTGWVVIGELIGKNLIVRGNTTDYTIPIAININDDAAADPTNEFRFAITAANTLKLQGRNATDDGWVDIFTWVRGTLAITAGAAIAMGGNKITGLAAATANGDAVRFEQPVMLTGDQTIADIKTFTSIPVLPASDATTDNQAIRKKQVTDLIAAVVIPYILVRDVQAQNTAGQSITAGSWQQVRLNTEETDSGNKCSLSSNDIILDAGTYECDIIIPIQTCGATTPRLYDNTGAATLLWGIAGFAQGGESNYYGPFVFIKGRFTLSVQSTLEIQVYPAANGTIGTARNLSDVSEYYTIAEFRKVA